MKFPIITGLIVFVFSSQGAIAACSTPSVQVVNNALKTLLSGNTVCAVRGGEKWQEEHHPNGILKDYKKGPNDKSDPTVQVGKWAVSGSNANTMVIYTYSNTQINPYRVWKNGGGSYSFCGRDSMDFTVKAGTGTGCP